MATGPAAGGLSTNLRIASRTNSATLRPDRAAAFRSASSSSLGRYTWFFPTYVNLLLSLTYVRSGRPELHFGIAFPVSAPSDWEMGHRKVCANPPLGAW